MPFWANRTNVVTVNGVPWTGTPIVAGTYLNIQRTWAAGDVVSVLFTPYIRFEQLNDDRDQWQVNGVVPSPHPQAHAHSRILASCAPLPRLRALQGVGAILYGTTLLAGITGSDALPIDPAKIEDAVKRTSDTNLTFTVSDACANTVTLIPLADIMNERYTVYWHTGANSGSTIGYNASG